MVKFITASLVVLGVTSAHAASMSCTRKGLEVSATLNGSDSSVTVTDANGIKSYNGKASVSYYKIIPTYTVDFDGGSVTATFAGGGYYGVGNYNGRPVTCWYHLN